MSHQVLSISNLCRLAVPVMAIATAAVAQMRQQYAKAAQAVGAATDVAITDPDFPTIAAAWAGASG